MMDKYDTQSAIMLLLQIQAYGQIYDRERLEEKKELQDVQFVSCMNPKAGSFMVNNRLQRYYTVVTTFLPTPESIRAIYGPILDKHLAQGFNANVKALKDPIVSATIDTLSGILSNTAFLPSASKFHYAFNLKDCANIFQGLLNTKAEMYKDGPNKYMRVWLHEANRVFGDRLVSAKDNNELQIILDKAATKHLNSFSSKEELFAEPLIFTTFMSKIGGNDKVYLPAKDMTTLKSTLDDQLRQHNEQYATMNLVLFSDAIKHITRICRIVDLPCGNALLVGVGGSGKQSLSRLSCFIMEMPVLTILVNQSYNTEALKLDLQEFYKKAAVKPGTPHAFLMTDGQVADERFLVFINDMLSSGNIPDLFTRE
jgi:dynein heavy chain